MAINRPLDVVNAKKWKELTKLHMPHAPAAAAVAGVPCGRCSDRSDPDIDFAFNLLDDEIYELTKHH